MKFTKAMAFLVLGTIMVAMLSGFSGISRGAQELAKHSDEIARLTENLGRVFSNQQRGNINRASPELKSALTSLIDQIKISQQAERRTSPNSYEARELSRNIGRAKKLLQKINIEDKDEPNIPSEDITLYFFCASHPDFRGWRECGPISNIRERNILEARRTVKDICTDDGWQNNASGELLDEVRMLHNRNCF